MIRYNIDYYRLIIIIYYYIIYYTLYCFTCHSPIRQVPPGKTAEPAAGAGICSGGVALDLSQERKGDQFYVFTKHSMQQFL